MPRRFSRRKDRKAASSSKHLLRILTEGLPPLKTWYVTPHMHLRVHPDYYPVTVERELRFLAKLYATGPMG